MSTVCVYVRYQCHVIVRNGNVLHGPHQRPVNHHIDDETPLTQ